jgi:hypothetical protein
LKKEKTRLGKKHQKASGERWKLAKRTWLEAQVVHWQSPGTPKPKVSTHCHYCDPLSHALRFMRVSIYTTPSAICAWASQERRYCGARNIWAKWAAPNYDATWKKPQCHWAPGERTVPGERRGNTCLGDTGAAK